MALHKAVEALAVKFQEQATALSLSDIGKRLSDALRDSCEQYEYCYVCDIFGDDQSGDVVYVKGGDCYKAPYEMTTVNGKAACMINFDAAVDVVPRTIYEEEAEDEDHMTAMQGMDESARAAAKALTPIERRMILGERFIPQGERDSAGSGSFAGKGKSFPILKAEDVKAAVSSMGRAGASNFSTAKLKANIIRIAKEKGFASSLPKAWQGDGAKEAAAQIAVLGDTVSLREGAVMQDGTAYLKLIAPGWGSSGYYGKELLERDGPKAFPAGTKNFWNHPTAAEEAARPEGDLNGVASILTEDARYDAAGPAGPGLYARAKVFEHFRQPVNELAPHIGMSIRAMGEARTGKAEGKSGQIIEKLTKGQSVDYVTEPGAGGKVLQLFEAARSPQIQLQEDATDMDAAELKKLQESNAALQAETRKLRERMAISDAATEARTILSAMALPEAVKDRVAARCVSSAALTEAGELDVIKFREAVQKEAADEAAYISKVTGGANPRGVGSAQVIEPAKIHESATASIVQNFMDMGYDEKTAKSMAGGVN
jgi:hypothetical protein